MACISTMAEQDTRDVFYSIGIDQTQNLKERIAEVHGVDSEPMKAVAELDRYISDPETRKSPWYWGFYKRVKSAMWALYPHADDIVRTRMASEFIDDLFNGGYIRVLQSLAVESGSKCASFARDYASRHSVPIGAALLFGPRGGASMELLHFLAAEKAHGMHRPGTSPDPCLSEETKKTWYSANRTANWPLIMNKAGEQVALDLAEEQGHFPKGVANALGEMWRRNPALRDYTGTNRLSGDIPFQIVEDAIDLIFRSRSTPPAIRTRYDWIVKTANQQGMDAFYAAYRQLFNQKDRLRAYWDKARTMLCEYSRMLWEKKNEQWLIEGKRSAAEGVAYRQGRISVRRPLKTSLPGTIYLNNGRYYWVVSKKMKPVTLVDERNRRALPGTIGNDRGRYFWVVPGVLKRQRLVARGEKFSTTNRADAERIALQMWKKLQIKKPKLAAKIRARRAWGTATKDRTTAEKIAREMWKQIQQENPELTAKILTDNRPVSEDHWIAQICAGGKHRHIGSFKIRREAMDAYVREFKKLFGYPPGYNVQAIPRLDKVWPTWAEEKARLDCMDGRPRMPVIGQLVQTQPLVFMIERMQRVNWLVKHLILALDNNSPAASADIAVQSRGNRWYEEIKKQGKRPVIRGSVSLDRDTRRIRITLYNQGFSDKMALAEEIYHIGFKIIRHLSPEIFEAIQRWHRSQLRKGADPTFSMPDMFSCSMALEESGCSTNLPRHVVKDVRKIFSRVNGVPDSVVEEVKRSWFTTQPG